MRQKKGKRVKIPHGRATVVKGKSKKAKGKSEEFNLNFLLFDFYFYLLSLETFTEVF